MKSVLSLVVIFSAFLCGAGFLNAQDLGQLEFPNTGAAEAQEAFLRGVLLLHSFEYPDARDAFLEAQRIDPGFLMAYWGEAMTYNHPIWQEVDLEKGRTTLQKWGETAEKRRARAESDRERAYLGTLEALYGEGDKKVRDLAYADAMRNLHEKYPDDLESASFYALSLLGTCHQGRDFAVYMKAAGVLEEVFDRNPKHPGAIHYLIHSYDDPIHAPLGLRPARIYAKTAPAAAHAQHMPSHIFVALGMWDEVVSSNEVSWKVSDERVQSRNLSVEERGFHALYWLQYGYLQQGRWKEARKTLRTMEEDTAKSGSLRTRTHLALMRASYIVEAGPDAGDAVRIEIDLSNMGISPAAAHLFSSGYAACNNGDLESARTILQSMKARREGAKESTGDSHHGMALYSRVSAHDLKVAEVMETALEAMILKSGGKTEEALELLEKAVEMEESLTFDFGPPEVVKPSQELLGEMLLAQNERGKAQARFQQALQRYPRRTHLLLGLMRSGDESKAEFARSQVEQILSFADKEVLESLRLNRMVHSEETQ